MHKYQILDIIDEGAYGIVWKAINKETQETVAIKEFKQTDEDESTKRTIQREIRMLKMLKGDHVVGIREAFKKKGKIYLIFQFFPSNLLNLIEVDNEGLQAKTIQLIVYKIIKCLKFLHQKNVIHRDIKPQNILLSQDQSVLKLCDFGFARFIPENIKDMTDYVATRWYRSPELLVGQPYQKPSDIFALGCIIGELVDGQPMFPGQDEIDQLHMLRKAIGELTEEQEGYLNRNEKFNGVDFPKIRRKQPLQERYLGKIEKNALSFMKGCLKMNASQRITAQQALRHPYLIQLSTKNRDFQNDEQNLLQSGRKTVPKHQMRGSLMSDIKQDDYITNMMQDQLTISKSKQSNVEKKKLLKGGYGSVDYSSVGKLDGGANHYKNNHVLMKKSSQQVFAKEVSPPKDIKNNKILKKNLSEAKNIKFNLDVNVNINVKFNKRSQPLNQMQDSGNKLLQMESESVSNIQRDLSKNGKLPQLKPKGFMSRKNDSVLFGIGRRIGERNNLSINGQSKQITKTLIGKKLQGLAVH